MSKLSEKNEDHEVQTNECETRDPELQDSKIQNLDKDTKTLEHTTNENKSARKVSIQTVPPLGRLKRTFSLAGPNLNRVGKN